MSEEQNEKNPGRQTENPTTANNKEDGKLNDMYSSENSTESEELDEKEAIAKYSSQNSKVNKAIEMFYQAFKQNVKHARASKCAEISKEIATCIYSTSATDFPRVVRTKLHNLKENKTLCMRIYSRDVAVDEFTKMSAEDMRTENMKTKDQESIKDSILSSRVAETAEETDMFQCGRCKQKKCRYSQLQTRSCDEPMTTFVYCVNCGHRWKF
ncbi:transcription elongation factor S-II [Enteropsectra breve]|nr:transcription elongation factor S-II [Enteropsectra breve]